MSHVFAAIIPMNVYMPACFDAGQRHLPTVILLHGAGADETQWPDLNVQSQADALIAKGTPPFMVFMPGGEYGPRLDYARFVADDLLPMIRNRYTTSTMHAIGGLSLGGFWAMRMAFAHPELFTAVIANSPVVSLGGQNNLINLANDPAVMQRIAQLPIALDVGSRDPLRDGTQALFNAFANAGANVQLTVWPGKHERAYWRTHTRAYLQFIFDR